jgi:uncharacterized protein
LLMRTRSASVQECPNPLVLGGFLPGARPQAGMSRADFWFRVLIGIPIGTAMFEELIFRGVLLASWDRLVKPVWSTVVVSVAFGLWHLGAEAERLGVSSVWSLSWAVLPGILATGLASAFVLCPLRRRTGDLAAPVVVHAAINVCVFVGVYIFNGTF